MSLARSGSQRLLDVGDQVLDILDADRQPDEAVVDAQARAHARWQRRVRHDRRMLGKALDTAETLRAHKNAAAFQEAPRRIQTALQNDRHHAAEAAHLPARERMLR